MNMTIPELQAILGVPYYAVELMPENAEKLKAICPEVQCVDFLTTDIKVDKVIMNPPFSHQSDIKHVMHAWKCLLPGGTLISVVSESPFFRENNLSKEFRAWLKENKADIIDLPRDAFKASGTLVKTRIIVVRKC